MDYVVKVPAILGDTCNVQAVSHAMAVKRATAADGEWDPTTYDAMLRQYSTWLRDEARSGQLITCNSSGIPVSWDELMNGKEPEDADDACRLAWVNLTHLNKWATKAGHTFTIDSKGVPWIDHRGVMGGSFVEPLEITIEGSGETLVIKPRMADRPTTSDATAEVLECSQENQLPAQPTVPRALKTTEIAECFGTLGHMTKLDYAQLKSRLGQKPKWLMPALVTPGQLGVREITWNPVKIGAALINKRNASRRSVRSLFQTKDTLKPWLGEWDMYESNFMD